jgi:hypothetical protein
MEEANFKLVFNQSKIRFEPWRYVERRGLVLVKLHSRKRPVFQSLGRSRNEELLCQCRD